MGVLVLFEKRTKSFSNKNSPEHPFGKRKNNSKRGLPGHRPGSLLLCCHADSERVWLFGKEDEQWTEKPIKA